MDDIANISSLIVLFSKKGVVISSKPKPPVVKVKKILKSTRAISGLGGSTAPLDPPTYNTFCCFKCENRTVFKPRINQISHKQLLHG